MSRERIDELRKAKRSLQGKIARRLRKRQMLEWEIFDARRKIEVINFDLRELGWKQRRNRH